MMFFLPSQSKQQRKLDFTPAVGRSTSNEQSEYIDQITPQNGQKLLWSNNALTHKIVYLAGYVVHK